MHLAAFHGHVAAVQLLVEAGAAVEAADHKGETPVRRATRKGRAEVLRLLLEAGAAPGWTDAPTSDSLLHAAASSGHIEVMRVLLQVRARARARVRVRVRVRVRGRVGVRVRVRVRGP